MACNSSGCQSGGCYKNGLEQEHKQDSNSETDVSSQQNLCVKCKANEPASGLGDDGRFCADCFRNNLFGKFRLAVTANAMITPSDNVLVALSGGPASRYAYVTK